MSSYPDNPCRSPLIPPFHLPEWSCPPKNNFVLASDSPSPSAKVEAVVVERPTFDFTHQSTPSPVLATPKIPPSRRQSYPNSHIPRPRNAFILFRAHTSGQIPHKVENDNRQISKIAGERWRALSDEEKRPWMELAAQEKREHAARYPDYRYKPTRKGSKSQKVTRSGSAGRINDNEERCRDVARLLAAGNEGEALEIAMNKRDEKRLHSGWTRCPSPLPFHTRESDTTTATGYEGGVASHSFPTQLLISGKAADHMVPLPSATLFDPSPTETYLREAVGWPTLFAQPTGHTNPWFPWSSPL